MKKTGFLRKKPVWDIYFGTRSKKYSGAKTHLILIYMKDFIPFPTGLSTNFQMPESSKTTPQMTL